MKKTRGNAWCVCLFVAFVMMAFTTIPAKAEGITIPEGIYTIQSAMDNTMVVDVYGGYVDYGTNIQLYSSNGGTNQQFYFEPVGNNWYRIVSMLDQQMSLDVYGGQSQPGSNVCLWGYHNQLWRFIPCGDGTFLIESNLGLYLDVEMADCRNEANIIAYSWNGDANQRWRLDALTFSQAFVADYGEAAYIPEDVYIIRSAMDSNMVVDAYNESTDYGTNIQLYSDHNGSNQRFSFVYEGEGWYRLLSAVDSNMCIDVYGGQPVAGSNVCLWEYHNQLWRFLPCDDGTYLIQSNLGLVLDVEHGYCYDEANIAAHGVNVNPNQRWWLDAVQ